ncbi:Uncharacterised protein [Prevotella intermedia]|nr:Uncharacterised protein [Prevotella intermedia]
MWQADSFSFLHSKALFRCLQYCPCKPFYMAKKDDRDVNIFHKYNYSITTCISIRCKTYCFAFQKRLFCTVKA